MTPLLRRCSHASVGCDWKHYVVDGDAAQAIFQLEYRSHLVAEHEGREFAAPKRPSDLEDILGGLFGGRR